MTSIGTHANPARARVKTEDRAFELLALCQDRRIQLVVELAPDEPEDIADIEQALIEREPIIAAPKIGRNEPCPCGSGKKFRLFGERRGSVKAPAAAPDTALAARDRFNFSRAEARARRRFLQAEIIRRPWRTASGGQGPRSA